MHKNELKKHICGIIDSKRGEILAIADAIYKNPELGFCEVKAAALVKKTLETLGLSVRDKIAITGCRADIKCADGGPTVAILGELDALPVPTHPGADPATGAAHACGHYTAIAGMLGAAMALSSREVRNELSGNIALMAVPAEEFQEHSRELIKEGKIKYAGGKPEFICLGLFDDVGIAMMFHAGHASFVPESYNGFVLKKILFHGKAAHAGLKPHLGINALSMARCALDLIDAQRDAFDEAESVRIHGFIPNGGTAINVVPALAEMALQVRAKTPSGVTAASGKVDSCIQAAALAFGGGAEIDTLSGYMSYKGCAELQNIHEINLGIIAPEEHFFNCGHRASSTDMGDVSMIIPSLHAYAGGSEGTPHTADFIVTDPEKAIIQPAKLMAMNTIDLLYGDAAEGKRIAALPTVLTRDEYFRIKDAVSVPKKWDYFKSK